MDTAHFQYIRRYRPPTVECQSMVAGSHWLGESPSPPECCPIAPLGLEVRNSSRTRLAPPGFSPGLWKLCPRADTIQLHRVPGLSTPIESNVVRP